MSTLGEEIEYEVVESADSTEPRIDVNIRQVKVVLPEECETDPDMLLRENAQWVLEKKQKYDAYRDDAPNRQFEPGEQFPFLGDQRTLTIDTVDEHHVTDDRIVLQEKRITESSIRDELEQLYRQKAREHFEDRVAHYADRMGVTYNTIAIRNQRTRWASCSPKENLSFNWRLLMAPPDVVDYVVVHELAHLEEKNHTNRFWRLVASFMPEYKEKANWLEENSAQLIFTEDDL